MPPLKIRARRACNSFCVYYLLHRWTSGPMVEFRQQVHHRISHTVLKGVHFSRAPSMARRDGGSDFRTSATVFLFGIR
jgi:hypothetical protein